MVKLFQMAAAAVFAAMAAASLIALATAAPGGENDAPKNCHNSLCVIAFF